MTESYDIYSLGIMAAVISFLGFTLENLWLAATKGFIDNRNMHLPFLYGYGLFITSYYLAVGTPEEQRLIVYNDNTGMAVKYLVYFALTFVTVSVGEIVIGELAEHCFGFYYWNYEMIPLHVT